MPSITVSPTDKSTSPNRTKTKLRLNVPGIPGTLMRIPEENTAISRKPVYFSRSADSQPIKDVATTKEPRIPVMNTNKRTFAASGLKIGSAAGALAAVPDGTTSVSGLICTFPGMHAAFQPSGRSLRQCYQRDRSTPATPRQDNMALVRR